MPMLNLVKAFQKALPNWDPAKHPRDRLGMFIEVGDYVHAYKGKDSPEPEVAGRVKAAYFAPDGRMFIGVESYGYTRWYRPKQLEHIKVKATIGKSKDQTPDLPLPAVDEQFEEVFWEDSEPFNAATPEHEFFQDPDNKPDGTLNKANLDQEFLDEIGLGSSEDKPSPSTVSQPGEVKIPAGKTPDDMLRMIGTSFDNKYDKDTSLLYPGGKAGFALDLQSMLDDTDFKSAHAKLAKLMTAAKMGGKQRKRYNSILAQKFENQQVAEFTPADEFEQADADHAAALEAIGFELPTAEEAEAAAQYLDKIEALPTIEGQFALHFGVATEDAMTNALDEAVSLGYATKTYDPNTSHSSYSPKEPVGELELERWTRVRAAQGLEGILDGAGYNKDGELYDFNKPSAEPDWDDEAYEAYTNEYADKLLNGLDSEVVQAANDDSLVPEAKQAAKDVWEAAHADTEADDADLVINNGAEYEDFGVLEPSIPPILPNTLSMYLDNFRSAINAGGDGFYTVMNVALNDEDAHTPFEIASAKQVLAEFYWNDPDKISDLDLISENMIKAELNAVGAFFHDEDPSTYLSGAAELNADGEVISPAYVDESLDVPEDPDPGFKPSAEEDPHSFPHADKNYVVPTSYDDIAAKFKQDVISGGYVDVADTAKQGDPSAIQALLDAWVDGDVMYEDLQADVGIDPGQYAVPKPGTTAAPPGVDPDLVKLFAGSIAKGQVMQVEDASTGANGIWSPAEQVAAKQALADAGLLSQQAANDAVAQTAPAPAAPASVDWAAWNAIADDLPSNVLIYKHPQGSYIVAYPNFGSVVKYKPDGKKAATSATYDKIVSGHGQWSYVGKGPALLLQDLDNSGESAPHVEPVDTADIPPGLDPAKYNQALADYEKAIATGTPEDVSVIQSIAAGKYSNYGVDPEQVAAAKKALGHEGVFPDPGELTYQDKLDMDDYLVVYTNAVNSGADLSFVKSIAMGTHPNTTPGKMAAAQAALQAAEEKNAAMNETVPISVDKSQDEVLLLLKTTMTNKGYLTYDTADVQFRQLLESPDLETALPKLNVLMTKAKLGGKQRKRYKDALAAKYGQGPMVIPKGEGKSLGGPGAKAPIVPSSGTNQTPVGVVGPTKGNQLVNPPTTGPQTAKATIQEQLSQRLRGRVTSAELISAVLESKYSYSHMMQDFAQNAKKYGGKGGLPSTMVLAKSNHGMWEVRSANHTAGLGYKEVVANPSKADWERALFETVANSLIQQWAGTSNDTNARALALQLAAKEEFGLTDTYDWPMNPSLKADTDWELNKHRNLYRTFLRVMYENTQDWAKANGVKQVRLRRGSGTYAGQVGSVANAKLRPMSSFSTNYSTAASFGGHRIEAYVPIEWVIGNAATGYGCQNEYEWVVLGGVHKVRVIQ